MVLAAIDWTPILVVLVGPGGLLLGLLAKLYTGRRQDESMHVKTADELVTMVNAQMDRLRVEMERQQKNFERRIRDAIEAERRECDEKIQDLERRHRDEIATLSQRMDRAVGTPERSGAGQPRGGRRPILRHSSP